MAFLIKEKLFSRAWFTSYALIAIGSMLIAIAYVFFIAPHHIVPGGVFGISIILNHVFNVPVGLTALAINIPLTIIGIKILGPRFGAKTVTGFVLSSVFLDLLTYFYGDINLTEQDTLLASIFGGAIIGIGIGLIFRAKATSGGSDVIAMIVAKYTRWPLGQLLMLVDSSIVIAGALVMGDWKMPLYAGITIFIIGKVVDTLIEGVSYEKFIFIISEKHEEIRQKIINDLNRGGTFLEGKGMFKKDHKEIIFTVVNRREVLMLQQHIHAIDPDAFMTVLDAKEIIGKGFKSLNDKVSV